MQDDDLGPAGLDSYQVMELEADDPHWMLELLANPAFNRVPASHYQGLLESFFPMEAAAGQVVIHQDAPGDVFYLIQSGRARVTRSALNGRVITLAELGPGQTFGEEALLTGAPRNATVTMLEAGRLMCLGAQAFHDLLGSALVKGLSGPAALERLKQGAQLVDVREQGDGGPPPLPGAVLLPLFLLRMRAGELDPARSCILYCDDGRRSSTAAFLLAQRGYDAHVLLGGMASLQELGFSPQK